MISIKPVPRGHHVCGWLIALVLLLSGGLAHGQTVQALTLSLDGARSVLHAAEQKAQQLTAPSSLAVVNPSGDLILFEQMQGARPIGIELAIGKARSAALFQESTQALEAMINTGRPAAITAERLQMQGGIPIQIGGAVVGAVGVSGFDKAKDVEIAETAAAAVK